MPLDVRLMVSGFGLVCACVRACARARARARVCVCVCVCVCLCESVLDIIHHWFVWLGLFMCTLIRYLRPMDTFFILIFTA